MWREHDRESGGESMGGERLGLNWVVRLGLGLIESEMRKNRE